MLDKNLHRLDRTGACGPGKRRRGEVARVISHETTSIRPPAVLLLHATPFTFFWGHGSALEVSFDRGEGIAIVRSAIIYSSSR